MTDHEHLDPQELLFGTKWQREHTPLAGDRYASELLAGIGGHGLGERIAPKPRPGFGKSISFDWDGVISRNPHWEPRYETVDSQLIEDALDRHIAVVIMTCSPVAQVASYLRELGFKVFADHKMSVGGDWRGGDDGRRILVTSRKVWGVIAYVDDRALHYEYDTDPSEVWRELDRQQGFAPCDGQNPRHWGPDGAAGILPWTVSGGQVHVLLSERAAGVQQGGCWSTIGGAMDVGETAIQAAFRELGEEVSGLDVADYDITMDREILCEHGCGWSYTTLSVYVEAPGGCLPPVGIAKGHSAWETRSLRWIPASEVAGMKLHTAFAASWPELESEIDQCAGALR